MTKPNSIQPLLAFLGTLLLLYFAKPVLIPFALAILLSFVVTPLVERLQHNLRFPRVAAVGVVTFSVFLLLAILTGVLFSQFLNVARDLPKYQNNLRTKLVELKGPVGPGLERTWRILEELGRELSTEEATDRPQPLEVQVLEPRPSAIEMLRLMLIPILKPLGTALVVIVFVVFMLMKREELRDKLIRLIGPHRITITTEALDEATLRVSRYLLMQTMINGGQGFVVGLFLYIIGVPNAALWGILSMFLRFIPYLGPWMAALMPITLSFIVFDTWTQPLITILMFASVELLTNNVFEPWLLGASTGVSSMALIVAAVFWTWLWGAPGLLLSTPLTVCLVVIGKYIPQLSFLHVLLAAEQVLAPDERLYQRLLAADMKEADRVLRDELKEKTLDETGQTLLLPALRLIERDYQLGALDEQRYEFVIERMKEVISATYLSSTGNDAAKPAQQGLVLCVAARDVADEAAAMIFAVLLRSKGIEAEWVSADALAGELLDLVREKQPAVICISSMPPSAVNHAKYICKRLRTRFTELPILVGLWESSVDPAQSIDPLTTAGADRVVSAPAEGVSQIQQWLAQYNEVLVNPTIP